MAATAIASRRDTYRRLDTFRLVEIHRSLSNRLCDILTAHSVASLSAQVAAIGEILADRGIPEPEIAVICPTCQTECEGPGCEWCDTMEVE